MALSSKSKKELRNSPPKTQDVLDELDDLVDEFREKISVLRAEFTQDKETETVGNASESSRPPGS